MGNKELNSINNPAGNQTPLSSLLSHIHLPKSPVNHQNAIKPPPKAEKNLNIIMGLVDKNKPQMLHFDFESETLKEVPPPPFQIYNYSSMVMLDHEHVYVTGGITYDLSQIVRNAYEMTSSIPIKFMALPEMITGRYTHMSIIHKQRLYAIGGRTYGNDAVGILNCCETLPLENLKPNKTAKWAPIANMNRPRCTGFLLIYQSEIYVFGGYTGQKKRSRKIERYNEAKNIWEVLDFRLKEGVESGSLYPIDLDEFVIVGGNVKEGLSRKGYIYNLNTETINEYSNLNNARVLQKTFIDIQRGNIFVLGGDLENTSEKLSYLTQENWKLVASIKMELFANVREIKGFCSLGASTIIHSVDESKRPATRENKKKEIEKYEEEKKIQFQPIGNVFKEKEAVKEKEHPNKESLKESYEKIKVIEEIKEDGFNEDEEVLPEETDHRMYLFGTDAESIILEYNLSKSRIRTVNVLHPLKLQCYQSGVKTSDSCYLIAGGINSSLDQIFVEVFLYMSFENMTIKLESMHTPRYTFNLVLQHPWVYALGGRSYGSDEVGVLNVCERYHLEKNIWESIASLNFKRCTAMAFSWSNGIYIAGGYMGSLKREKRFECYIESLDKWELMGIELDEALEASSLLVSNDKLLFIGGRIQTGDTDKIWCYDVANGFDAFHGEKIGNLKSSRCLHKSYKLDKDNFLVLGGKNYENIFETFFYNRENNTIVNNGEKAFEFMRKAFLKNIRRFFKESALHKNLLL